MHNNSNDGGAHGTPRALETLAMKTQTILRYPVDGSRPRVLARSGAFVLLIFGGLGFAALLLRPSAGALALFGIPAAAASGTAWATLAALRKDRAKGTFLGPIALWLNLLLLAFGAFHAAAAEEPWSILSRPLGVLFAIGGLFGSAGLLSSRSDGTGDRSGVKAQ